jgi:uncharacterized protein (DUF1684 family)
MKSALYFIAIVLLFSSCRQNKNGTEKYTAIQADSMKIAFNDYLSQRNRSFSKEPWSPLLDSDRESFHSLKYFDYDINWHFEGKLELLSDPDTVIIHGSKGEERKCFNYAYFNFSKDGSDYRLLILKFPAHKIGAKPYLFLGFWDKTSGNETYGGGRYIDIEENEENYYVIDFNYAYNPYCAYNHRYTCAVPPLKNRLPLAIKAGEKTFKEH